MKFLVRQFFILLGFFISVSSIDCKKEEQFCSSTQTCISKNVTCLNRCDLCMTRQRSGENIACINDCDYNTLHLTSHCMDTHCQDITSCPSGYILQKNNCQCSCIPLNINCSRNFLCPKITALSIPNDNINGYTVYELSLILKPDAYNIYAIYGDNDNNMIIPSAYQVHQHLGANIGGINPVILNYIHESIFDSWFTISVTDGNDMGYINSIGIDWNNWSQTNGITVNNGAIFLNDPILKLSNTNEYVIAHLTVDDTNSHQLIINVNGKINAENILPKDMAHFQEENIVFNIPKKITNS